MEFLKNKAPGYVMSLVTVVCAVVSMIAFSIMANDGEGVSDAVMPLMVGGIVLCLANLFLCSNNSLGRYFGHGSAAACLAFGAACVMFVFGRMTWFMNIASKNDVTPLHPAFFVAAAMFIATLVVSIVNSFMELKKD